jgi:hypothetical protein
MSEPRVPRMRSIPAGYVPAGGEASGGPGAVIPDAAAGGAGAEPGLAGQQERVGAGFTADAAAFRQELARGWLTGVARGVAVGEIRVRRSRRGPACCLAAGRRERGLGLLCRLSSRRGR